jgi:microcystin-dependent protein
VPEPFLGEVQIFAGNFAPTGWAFCDGQILPISQNTALFSLLGTTYGGNGVSTFALPDLRGRVPIQPGQGPGLSLRSLGEQGGIEGAMLGTGEMPAHTHTLGASSANGTSDAAAGRVAARSPAAIPQYAAASDADLSAAAIGSAGGGQAHNNMQPYLGLSFIIALQGIYPPRP